MFANPSAIAAIAATTLMLAAPAAAATLIQYDFDGAAGNQAFTAATNVATGVTGVNFTRNNLGTPSGADSMNSNGWTNADAYLSFGFSADAGYTATVDQLLFTTRSSGTGPDLINLLLSVDGGAFTTLATLNQPGTSDLNSTINFLPVTGTNFQFRFAAASQTSANGGTIAGGGTFRVGNYQGSTPVSLNGSVSPLAAAVPEPASWAMMIGGFSLVGGAMRRRKSLVGRFA